MALNLSLQVLSISSSDTYNYKGIQVIVCTKRFKCKKIKELVLTSLYYAPVVHEQYEVGVPEVLQVVGAQYARLALQYPRDTLSVHVTRYMGVQRRQRVIQQVNILVLNENNYLSFQLSKKCLVLGSLVLDHIR